MTTTELINELGTMPPTATVWLWCRSNDPQYRELKNIGIEKVNPKSGSEEGASEIVVLD